jgi:uncharacterized protein
MWLDLVLLGQAALLGLWGSVHCAAMCGPMCAVCLPQARSGTGVSGPGSSPRFVGWIRPAGASPRDAARQLPRGFFPFLGARALSYGLLGILISASAGLLRDMAQWAAWIKPIWLAVHVLLLLGGAWMIITGRWIDQLPSGGWLGQQVRRARQSESGQARWQLGFFWGLWPCGILYGALMLAALTNHPAFGGLSMVVFAVASAPGLALGTWLVARASGRHQQPAPGAPSFKTGEAPSDALPRWLVRVSGAVIVLGSLWALAHDALTAFVAWCIA